MLKPFVHLHLGLLSATIWRQTSALLLDLDHVSDAGLAGAGAANEDLMARSFMSAPGPKTEVAPVERHVRSILNSRHRQATPACPFRAKTGSRSSLDHFVGAS